MAVRVRAWLLACTTLLILLVPIAVAGTALAGPERGPTALAAAGPHVPSPDLVSVPTKAATTTRQAYDLLLDNFVTPPAPSSLLLAAATEFGRRTGDRRT